MTDNDVVVLDRNCHKSIEQGLILTGAKPVYMVPSRNRYGIIGPIYPQEMQPETLQKKISASPLTKTKAGQKPSYSVVTNCTYDGVCYNAKERRICWQKPAIAFTSTKHGTAMRASTRFIAITTRCAASQATITVRPCLPPTPRTNY
ncbi:arginine decarboxylase [Salmonella enterica subsp. enterica serovar Thompson]|nr:arginine decarboxylase [Salmonella enterica subsp. enterica serovar Thompson]